MDHPNAPKEVLLPDGRWGCSHPKCTSLAFRGESGLGLHFVTVHTVPFGAGLSVASIDSRIVDWDEVAMKKLEEARTSAVARVEQIETIIDARKKCEFSLLLVFVVFMNMY
jgi:hypothetical protein